MWLAERFILSGCGETYIGRGIEVVVENCVMVES
jgi:hypothetical protein